MTQPGGDGGEADRSGAAQNGVQATSIQDELKDGQKQSAGFLYIIEGFMGLGLMVGYRGGRRDRVPLGGRAAAADRRAAGARLPAGDGLALLPDRDGVHRRDGRDLGARRSGWCWRGTCSRATTAAESASFLVPWPIITIDPERDDGSGAADGVDSVPPGGADRSGGGAAVRISRAVVSRIGSGIRGQGSGGFAA